MLKFLKMAVLILLLVVGGAVHAASASPEAVVRQLYPLVPGEGNPVIDLMSEASPCLVCFASEVIERDENGLQEIFTEPLATFLKRWAEDEGVWVLECVDFEPLVDGQESIITGFVMMTQSMDDTEAKVLVRFNNFETPVRLRFDLLRRDGAWLIDDIESPRYSLREIIRPCLD
ncbi:MAG: hypothetical protein R3179_09780 [Sedimenticolaceae bacterium]|nr:hypothetical protein [Sedimenticolaceae bacterium]